MFGNASDIAHRINPSIESSRAGRLCNSFNFFSKFREVLRITANLSTCQIPSPTRQKECGSRKRHVLVSNRKRLRGRCCTTKFQIGKKALAHLVRQTEPRVFVKHRKRHAARFGQFSFSLLHALAFEPFERLLPSGSTRTNQTAAGTNRRQNAVNFIGHKHKHGVFRRFFKTL